MEKRNYNIIGQVYNQTIEAPVDPMANGFAAVNQGDVDVTVNGVLLKPNPNFAVNGLAGETFSVDGNENEYYKGRLNIVFEAGGASPRVQIIQKFYIR